MTLQSEMAGYYLIASNKSCSLVETPIFEGECLYFHGQTFSGAFQRCFSISFLPTGGEHVVSNVSGIK